MPKSLHVRIAESLDVSGAFDNCFFHSYSAHLLAQGLPLPDDMFTFTSILGDDSNAAQLQKRFPNLNSLSLFAEYAQQVKPDERPISPSFIVEKTLVLGILMREWFATKMAQRPEIRDEILAAVLVKFDSYKAFRPVMSADDLLTGPEGLLYSSNRPFLEYFTARPKEEAPLTEEEMRFEQYFIDAADEEHALTAYWREEGYLNYCRQFASPHSKLAHTDVVPMMERLEQPLTIYNASEGIIYRIDGDERKPAMDVLLEVYSGHYHLLKTDETTAILDEYDASFAQYKQDRAEVLGDRGDRLLAIRDKPSLLLGAIFPAEFIDEAPFTLLLNTVDRLPQLILAEQARKLEYERKVKEALEYSVAVMDKIDNVLQILNRKIGQINQHHDSKAFIVASTLLDVLQSEQTAYRKELQHVDVNREEAGARFKEQCAIAIKAAYPVLERDLGWGDFLVNLLKAIGNAVIWALTVSYVPAFFTPVRAKSVKVVDEAAEDLDIDLSESIAPKSI